MVVKGLDKIKFLRTIITMIQLIQLYNETIFDR